MLQCLANAHAASAHNETSNLAEAIKAAVAPGGGGTYDDPGDAVVESAKLVFRGTTRSTSAANKLLATCTGAPTTAFKYPTLDGCSPSTKFSVRCVACGGIIVLQR